MCWDDAPRIHPPHTVLDLRIRVSVGRRRRQVECCMCWGHAPPLHLSKTVLVLSKRGSRYRRQVGWRRSRVVLLVFLR